MKTALIWAIQGGHEYLQVIMLPFLLSFQVESGQPAQVLLTDGFVHSGSAADPLPVVVSCVCPPVSFGLHIPQDHVLNRSWQPWHLGRDMNLTEAGMGACQEQLHLAGIRIEAKGQVRDLPSREYWPSSTSMPHSGAAGWFWLCSA